MKAIISIQTLVSESNFDLALNELFELTNSLAPASINSVILLQGRYAALKKAEEIGLINSRDPGYIQLSKDILAFTSRLNVGISQETLGQDLPPSAHKAEKSKDDSGTSSKINISIGKVEDGGKVNAGEIINDHSVVYRNKGNNFGKTVNKNSETHINNQTCILTKIQIETLQKYMDKFFGNIRSEPVILKINSLLNPSLGMAEVSVINLKEILFLVLKQVLYREENMKYMYAVMDNVISSRSTVSLMCQTQPIQKKEAETKLDEINAEVANHNTLSTETKDTLIFHSQFLSFLLKLIPS